MEISQTTLGYASGIIAGYGLANYTSGHKDFHRVFHGHNGGVLDGLAELSYSKELNTGYVFMVNTGNWPVFDRISKTIRAYLLKDHKVTKPQPIALPEKYKKLNGYYAPINHRQNMTRALNSVFGVMKFETDDTYMYRQPLLGGWDAPGKAYAINSENLIEQWSGQPTIALVEDPIEGSTVQIGADLFKPVSALTVFSQLGLYAALFAISLLSFLAMLVWGSRRLVKKIPTDASVWIRIWPLLASLILLGLIGLLSLAGTFMQAAAIVSPLSMAIYILGIIYPMFAAASGLPLIKYRKNNVSAWIYWYAFIYVALHILMSIYLIHSGLIPLKLWS